ncbi:hypothetical protein NDU88_006392 [Pleurodeles waltl]|uniref:Uncharacterized protein n=1 Tax=Pleurodeles waltl TaxID=8319 RepID=A0AAV7LSH3_PLEWA|nr:hypothetical protein NDU88_006392 [Pleurodeles waltl]
MCAGSRGDIRDHQADPSAGPEFRPSPPPVTALSVSAYYQPGPALSCRGPGDLKARRETPAGGRERPTMSGPPAAARTRIQFSKKKKGGGKPRSDTTADQAPPKSLSLPSSLPSTGGAAAASPLSAHTAGAGARGRPPAPGLSALLRPPGASSFQTRLEQRRRSPWGEAPGARSLTTARRIDYVG